MNTINDLREKLQTLNDRAMVVSRYLPEYQRLAIEVNETQRKIIAIEKDLETRSVGNYKK